MAMHIRSSAHHNSVGSSQGFEVTMLQKAIPTTSNTRKNPYANNAAGGQGFP